MKILSMAWVGILLAGSLQASAPQQRKTPYWASLAAGQARMRSGPGRNYPASWLYQRQGLPVQVTEVYPGWRKVRDPDGESGWMITSPAGTASNISAGSSARQLRIICVGRLS